MDMFIPGVWDAPIKEYALEASASLESLNRYRRKGHSEPQQTDREWDQLRTANKLRYNKWRKLTDELIEAGVLDNAPCYECSGELEYNDRRPTRWVWDETEEEHAARVKERG